MQMFDLGSDDGTIETRWVEVREDKDVLAQVYGTTWWLGDCWLPHRMGEVNECESHEDAKAAAWEAAYRLQ